MASYHYLYCQQTDECVEVVACVGNWKGPRIEANALQAYLAYHFLTAPGAPLVIWEAGSITYGRYMVDCLEELAQQKELAGDPPREKPPVLVWTEQNHRALAARAEGLGDTLRDFEAAPSGGIWVLRTSDGRLIEPAGSQGH